jgi:hypothetical protein
MLILEGNAMLETVYACIMSKISAGRENSERQTGAEENISG